MLGVRPVSRANAYDFVVTKPAFANWQGDLIETLRVARLATMTPHGTPHIVPVCFAKSGDSFVIPVDEKPKASRRLARLRNIAYQPKVSLLFDHYSDDWTTLAWVRVDGLATVLERGDQRPAALHALRARYPQYRQMALEGLPLIVIAPIAVAGWRWANG